MSGWAAIRSAFTALLHDIPGIVKVLPGVPSERIPNDQLPAIYPFYQGTSLVAADGPIPVPVYTGFVRVLVRWIDAPDATESTLAPFVDSVPLFLGARTTLDTLASFADRITVTRISADENSDGFFATPGSQVTYRTLTVYWEIQGPAYELDIA